MNKNFFAFSTASNIAKKSQSLPGSFSEHGDALKYFRYTSAFIFSNFTLTSNDSLTLFYILNSKSLSLTRLIKNSILSILYCNLQHININESMFIRNWKQKLLVINYNSLIRFWIFSQIFEITSSILVADSQYFSNIFDNSQFKLLKKQIAHKLILNCRKWFKQHHFKWQKN